MMPFLLHPSRPRLASFAAGGAVAGRGRVARHLERCIRCRQFVGFTQRLEKAVAALPTPAPGEELLSRALADRASGVRVILPAPMEPAREIQLPGAARVVAVILVAAVLGIWWSSRGDHGEFASANELLLAGFVPRNAEAWQGSGKASAMTHRLRPVAVTYQRRFIDGASGRVTDGGTLDLRVIPTSSERWLLTSTWRAIEGQKDMSNARTWTESLTVAGSALVPVSRVVHVKPYRRWAGINIDQRFHNDSVVGQMSLDDNPTRRPIARDLREQSGRLIVSDALAPMYFMGVPLATGAAFDVSFLGWAVVPHDVAVPMHLKVVGTERIETPAGTFDCWKFVISVGGETHYHWVRQSDHLGVRTLRRLDDGRTREVILVHEGASR